jgi:hypothetical protein
MLLLCYCPSASLLLPADAPIADQSSGHQTPHQHRHLHQQLLLQPHVAKAQQQLLLLLLRGKTLHETTLLLLLLQSWTVQLLLLLLLQALAAAAQQVASWVVQTSSQAQQRAPSDYLPSAHQLSPALLLLPLLLRCGHRWRALLLLPLLRVLHQPSGWCLAHELRCDELLPTA